MTYSTPPRYALVMTPMGRDAEVARALLREIDIDSVVVTELSALVAGLNNDVLFVVLSEDALRTSDLRALAEWAKGQPSWSDLTFILLTQHGGGPERNPAAARISEALGNVNFLERPFHPTTFASVAKSAIKGRYRQFEIRAAFDELREGEERLQTALLAGRLGSWEFNVETLELTTSSACKAVFGRLPNESLTYKQLLSSIHPEDLPSRDENMRRTLETGEDYVIEYRTVWPDKSVHWAEVRARLVSGQAGRKLIGVSMDITERKDAEERLRTENERLEDRVADRTRELESALHERDSVEEKLRQSQKMETIGQLTGGIAHDFNNLLMAVIGNLDLLKKNIGDDPKTVRLIDGALQGAHRGATLTQRLLAFARKQDLSLATADLVDLVRGLTPLVERTIGSGIELRFDVPSKPVYSEVDVNQVELALLNLVVNARDAMPNGGTLRIGVDTRSAPDHTEAGSPSAVVSVSDTGEGMDSDTLKRAMEPFFSTKGVGKGTGLGLSMVHGLSQQLGGEFQITSALGFGTTASLILPISAQNPQDKSGKDMARPQTEPSLDIKLRVLLVDDDLLISMSTAGMLEDLGHNVLEANSGAAAMKLLQDGEPVDVMITDFSMPKMNGMELAKAALNLRPGLPILLATGYAELPPGTEKIDLPRLSKPYDQAQLELELRNLLVK